MKAGEIGQLYVPYDENGWPIEVRCARHVFGIERILANYSEMYEEPIIVTGMPSYDELVEKMEWVPTSMSLPRDQGRIDRNVKKK